MILAIRYSVKGVKKAHQSYKKHQAEKEQKLLEERGQLPDLQDPSRELDVSCLAEETKSTSALSRTSSKSSLSSASAEKALENDPSFKEYMEKQKALYLTHHRSHSSHSSANPPSYNSIMHHQSQHSSPHSPTSAATLSPTSSLTGHCSCHDCVRTMSSSTPQPTRAVSPLPSVPELPPATNVPVIAVQQETKISELACPQQRPVEIMSQQDDAADMIFELPGNMPAILPLKKPETPVELPTQPA